jgi:hypothetical protein
LTKSDTSSIFEKIDPIRQKIAEVVMDVESEALLSSLRVGFVISLVGSPAACFKEVCAEYRH